MAYDKSAEIKVHIAASPGRVWAAFTDPDALTAWYWPAEFSPKATSDARVGGRFGIATASADMGFAGEYLELEPPQRIVQSWRWAGDDRDSRVTIELSPAGDGTDVVVTHDRVNAHTAAMYRAGWQSCLDRLPEYLA
jgi:uncharacterized protein YndB with AHSA1/START domain